MRYIKKFFSVVLVCFLAAGIFSQSQSLSVYGAETGNFTAAPNMRIGLVYGGGMVESFQTSSDTGFIFGNVQKNASDAFNVFFYIKNTNIAVSRTANLTKNSAGKYYASGSNIVIGKYNIEFDASFSNFTEAYNFIGNLPKGVFKNPFAAYINGGIAVRFGNFTSSEAAKSAISEVSASSPTALNVAAESSTTTVVINPGTNEILFQYEDGGNNFAAAAAVSSSKNLSYGQSISKLTSQNTGFTNTPANNIYCGAFVYRINSRGVEVINLVSLEDYVKGVIPYEISPTWNIEALKAFSVAVRTYALKSMHNHESDGFMMCNDSHCQLFLGSGRATDYTNSAVDATKDLVAAYDNQIILAVYHSSSGGVTENHNDAWGGELKYPYLTSVRTPFEKYAEPGRTNSIWTRSASPKELYDYLVGSSSMSSKFKGRLNSEIANIIINERSPSSNYIKSVSVIDVNGNSVTIQNSDTVRSAFARYASSANMDIYKSLKFKGFTLSSKSTRAVNQEIETGKTYMLTGNGLTRSMPGDGVLNVLTASGKYTTKATVKGTNFIFDGRGWGHGVGLSQWGMEDMAELGYKYDEILKKFYTGISIENITNVKG